MHRDKKWDLKYSTYTFIYILIHTRGVIYSWTWQKNMFPSGFPTKLTNPLFRVADIHIVLIQICNKRTFKTSCLFSVFLVLEIPNYNIIQSKLVSLQSNRVSQNFSISWHYKLIYLIWIPLVINRCYASLEPVLHCTARAALVQPGLNMVGRGDHQVVVPAYAW